MDNKEEILNALEDFGRKPSENIPEILEDYLRQIAKTGQTMFPWVKLKPLFEQRLDQAMKEFHSRVPMEQLPSSPNVENVTFDMMRERLLESVNTFTGAPFTIQRLCELVTSPGKHYQRTDKYLRGIEKNVLVVSTVDPFGRKIVNESSQMIVNGMEQSTATPITKPGGPNRAPPNSPSTLSEWFSSHGPNVDSPSRFPHWSSSTSSQQQQPSQQPLQAMGKLSDATSSSEDSGGGSLGNTVWDTNISDLTSSGMQTNGTNSKSTDLDPLQAAEGVLTEIEKGAADNVSSSSDSSTNESSLSDLSNDSEAEFTATKSDSLETQVSDGDRDSQLSQMSAEEASSQEEDAGEQAVTTSEEGVGRGDGETATDREEKEGECTEAKAAEATPSATTTAAAPADISSAEEMGQGDATCTSADDIEMRRSSGGFDTTKSVSSVMSDLCSNDDGTAEPSPKKPRLDIEDNQPDLSSSTSSSTVVEEPSQSVVTEPHNVVEGDKEEETVGSSEGITQDTEMSSSSDVEHSKAEDKDSSSTSSSVQAISSADAMLSSEDNTLVQSSDSAAVTQCNTSEPETNTEPCSSDSAISSVDSDAPQTAESQCDSASPVTVSDSSTSQQQPPPDSAGPVPMETD